MRYVDNFLRQYKVHPTTTITTNNWSLLYAVERGVSELYDLRTDSAQTHNVIEEHEPVAQELHQRLVQFMHDTKVAPHLLQPRLELLVE